MNVLKTNKKKLFIVRDVQAEASRLPSLVTRHSSLPMSLVTRHLSLFLILLLSSCSLTEPNYSPENQIKNTLYDISRWFDYKNIAPILELVDEDYLHNGMTKWNFRELWLDRMGQYALLDISAIQVTFNGDYATVKMVLEFTDSDGNLILNEPGDSGDLSYFHYNGFSWVICGNQFVP